MARSHLFWWECKEVLRLLEAPCLKEEMRYLILQNFHEIGFLEYLQTPWNIY